MCRRGLDTRARVPYRVLVAVTLRDFRLSDLDALWRLDQECYAPGIAYSKRELRDYLSLRGAECLIAQDDDFVAGFLLAEHVRECAHIITIDVAEIARRRRIGSTLLEEIERRLAARGVKEVELETATNNLAAIAFWQCHGYRTEGVIPHYYLNRIDAYAMRKLLPAAKEI